MNLSETHCGHKCEMEKKLQKQNEGVEVFGWTPVFNRWLPAQKKEKLTHSQPFSVFYTVSDLSQFVPVHLHFSCSDMKNKAFNTGITGQDVNKCNMTLY